MINRNLTVGKIARLIKHRADLTYEISEVWESLTEKELDAMNDIITRLKRANQGESPISMSLDELSIMEREWADEVHELAERKGE